jgi:hypothetical protein
LRSAHGGDGFGQALVLGEPAVNICQASALGVDLGVYLLQV